MGWLRRVDSQRRIVLPLEAASRLRVAPGDYVGIDVEPRPGPYRAVLLVYKAEVLRDAQG